MCPNEAIAAAGVPYFFEAQLDPKWHQELTLKL